MTMAKKLRNSVACIGTALLLLFTHNSLAAPDLVGVWTSYDLSGTARSHIKIYKTGSSYSGKIVKQLNAKRGQQLHDTCVKCRGAMKDKPMIGMKVIWGLKKADKGWKGGKVLDTDSGKTYNFNAKLSSDGRTLHFHAYVGTPLFGKTVNWKRHK